MDKTHLISGRIVSGIPFEPIDVYSLNLENERRYHLDPYGKKIYYEMIIAIDKESREVTPFFEKINAVTGRAGSLTDYDDQHKKECSVDYCAGCYLIYIYEPPPLVLVEPNDQRTEWVSIDKHLRAIKAGDYVKVELEIAVASSPQNESRLYFKPNFLAFIKSGEEVDLKRDTAKKHEEMLTARASKILGDSTSVPPNF